LYVQSIGLGYEQEKDEANGWSKQLLPELLGFDPRTMSGKNFWYAAMRSFRKELKAEREAG